MSDTFQVNLEVQFLEWFEEVHFQASLNPLESLNMYILASRKIFCLPSGHNAQCAVYLGCLGLTNPCTFARNSNILPLISSTNCPAENWPRWCTPDTSSKSYSQPSMICRRQKQEATIMQYGYPGKIARNISACNSAHDQCLEGWLHLVHWLHVDLLNYIGGFL